MSNQPLHPQTAGELADLMMKLSGNPKTRQRLLSMVKEVQPNYRAPADVQLAEFKEQTRIEREKERADWQKQQLANARAKQRNHLIESGRYDEQQVKEIEEKVMKHYGLGDYEAAAKIYASDTAPAKPREGDLKYRHGKIWEFPDLPGLMQNPEKAALDAAYSVIDELRAGKR